MKFENCGDSAYRIVSLPPKPDRGPHGDRFAKIRAPGNDGNRLNETSKIMDRGSMSIEMHEIEIR